PGHQALYCRCVCNNSPGPEQECVPVFLYEREYLLEQLEEAAEHLNERSERLGDPARCNDGVELLIDLLERGGQVRVLNIEFLCDAAGVLERLTCQRYLVRQQLAVRGQLAEHFTRAGAVCVQLFQNAA